MRPARPADLPRLEELWRREVRAGRRDTVPRGSEVKRLLSGFDWEAKSRVIEDGDSEIAGMVFVLSRGSPEGVVAYLEVAGPPAVAHELAGWGLQLSRAAGAALAQVWTGHGGGEALQPLGFGLVRPWWRMDRSLAVKLPTPKPVEGYELRDGDSAKPGSWEHLFNNSFADHWHFSPRSEEELTAGKQPELCLMAVTAADGRPAAITHGQIETYIGDPRPQPVGLISAVGTVPEDRRRGLAGWLMREVMQRLQNAGARHASLYVDAWSPFRAYDTYTKLGFQVAFEAEVWEATVP